MQIKEDVRTILIPRVKARLERAHDELAALIGEDFMELQEDTANRPLFLP